MIIEASAFNLLALTQTISVPIKVGIVSNQLTLTQTINTNKKIGTCFNSLVLQQSLVITNKILQRTVTNTLNLSQYTKRMYYETINHNLTLFHYLSTAGIDQSLNLTQSIDVVKVNPITNTLDLVQDLTYVASIQYQLANTLNLIQSANAFKPNATFINGNFVPGSYPYTELTFNGNTIQLRNPSFQNSDTLIFTRILRESRGGDLIVFRDTHWAKDRSFKMEFSLLDKTLVDALKLFLRLSLGKIITLKDYLNVTHNVLVLNPNTEFIEAQQDHYIVNLEFQKI